MAIAGRVAIVPKGDWSADATYKRLDAVTYNNTLYFAKKEVPAGTATSNTEYWSKSIVGGAGAIATTEDAGIVKPADGLTVAEDGTLKVNIDGTTLTMDQVNNVIKLADTLKDKIGSALQPESIVNNQITTEEGFALDARQANPNIDGTLAKQISDLNGSLNGRLVKSASYDFDVELNDTNRADCIKKAVNQLKSKGTDAAIATIRYSRGFYTTNIVNCIYNSATILECDFADIGGVFHINYWVINGETIKLVKQLS